MLFGEIFSLRKNYTYVVALILALIGSTLAVCINPLIYKNMFDVALPTKNVSLLIFYLSISLGLLGLSILSSYVGSLSSAKLGSNIGVYFRLKIFHYIQNIHFDRHEKNLEERILTQFTEDVSFLEQILIFSLWVITDYLIIGLVSIILLIYLNIFLFLIMVVLLPSLIYLGKWFSKKSKKDVLTKREAEIDLVELAKEGITAGDIIRHLRLKNYLRRIFKLRLKKAKEINYHYNLNLLLAGKSASLGIDFVTLIIIALGAYFVVLDQMTVGSLIGFVVVLGNLRRSINTISTHYPSVVRGEESLSRIHSLIDRPKTSYLHYGKKTLPPLKEGIEFKNVSSHYEGKPALSNINLKIKLGEYVGIVGPSGAGKSTLLKLLLRDIPISSGQILLDGKDSKDYSYKSLYSQIGVVSQRPVLLNMSIMENIRLGKIDATDEEVMEAARMAEIHEDILRMPVGYHTIIHSNDRVSYGQIQRIAIARALISKPAILCLDEATASLDPINAVALDETFSHMKGKVTIISATHRLQQTLDMDRIFVINHGQLVETGTFEELLRQEGLFHHLWEKQSGVRVSPDLHRAEISIPWLKAIPMFNMLDETSLSYLANQFIIERYEPDTIVFEEKDLGDKFYIIVSGKVEISKFNKKTRERRVITYLSDGDFFGEIALLYQLPRNARVTTQGVCIFLTLYQQKFYEIFDMLPDEVQTIIKSKARERYKSEKNTKGG